LKSILTVLLLLHMFSSGRTLLSFSFTIPCLKQSLNHISAHKFLLVQ
jgi:hypothetical protein